MAISLVLLTVVDVGQGQSTFVEMYDDSKPDPKLVHTLLIDCGTDKESDDTPVNLTYIRDKVQTMATPAFDCIVYSHSDKDHISLTKQLLESFPKRPQVKKVWYGGAYDLYKKGRVTRSNPEPNVLDWLVSNKYCTYKQITSPGSNFTDYKRSSDVWGGALWRSPSDEVQLCGVVANIMSANPDWKSKKDNVKGKTAEAKNRVSIVCGLYFDGTSFIICGDATNDTMSAVNKLFIKGTTVFNNNFMTTLPHHGSRTTGFKVKKGENPKPAARLVVDTFATLLKSKVLTASAYEKHRHPSLMLMNAFIPGIDAPFIKDARLTQKNAHRLSCYVDINLDVEAGADKSSPKKRKRAKTTLATDEAYSFDTNTCTFTTRYTDDDARYSYNLGLGEVKSSEGVALNGKGKKYTINGHACWQFEKYLGDPIVRVGGYANLGLPLVLFTSGADSIQPGTMGRIGIWELYQDDPTTEKPIAKTREKTNKSGVKKPVSTTPQLQGQLKQFH